MFTWHSSLWLLLIYNKASKQVQDDDLSITPLSPSVFPFLKKLQEIPAMKHFQKYIGKGSRHSGREESQVTKHLVRIFGSLHYGTGSSHSLCQHTLSNYKAQKLCTRPDLKETEQFTQPKSDGESYTTSSAFISPLSFLAYERIPCKFHRKAHLENSTKFYKIKKLILKLGIT